MPDGPRRRAADAHYQRTSFENFIYASARAPPRGQRERAPPLSYQRRRRFGPLLSHAGGKKVRVREENQAVKKSGGTTCLTLLV